MTPGPHSHSTGISSIVLPVGDEMPRRVEVRAHVVRRHDVLRVDAVLGLALDVLHLERRIVRPERKLLVQRLRQIVDLHSWLPSSAGPIRANAARAARTRVQRARVSSTLARLPAIAADAWMSLGGSMSLRRGGIGGGANRLGRRPLARSASFAACSASIGRSPTLSSAMRALGQRPFVVELHRRRRRRPARSRRAGARSPGRRSRLRRRRRRNRGSRSAARQARPRSRTGP